VAERTLEQPIIIAPATCSFYGLGSSRVLFLVKVSAGFGFSSQGLNKAAVKPFSIISDENVDFAFVHLFPLQLVKL